MRKLIIILVISLSINFSFSQTTTEKWNEYKKQYEYFDSRGNMIAYKVFNSYLNQWETYSVQTTTYEVKPSVNPDLVQKTLTNLQARYDYNLNKISVYINKCYETIDNSNMDYELKQKIKNSFYTDFIVPYHNEKYDLSSDAVTNKLINWLQTGLLSIIEYEKSIYNQKSKTTEEEVLSLNKFYGGYKIPLLYEYELNNNKYSLIIKETSNNFVYYNGSTLYFKRSSNSTWLMLKLLFNNFNPNLNAYSFSATNNTTVYIDKDFKMITIIQDNKKYEYMIGSYDSSIRPK